MEQHHCRAHDHRMDTPTVASPEPRPGESKRQNPDDRSPASPHRKRGKPRFGASVASGMEINTNTTSICASTSPFSNVRSPAQDGSLLPFDPKKSNACLPSSKKPVVFGVYSQNQANKQETTSLRIKNDELRPALTPFKDLSVKDRELIQQDHQWWEDVSNQQYRRMLEEGDTSQNFEMLQSLVQGQ